MEDPIALWQAAVSLVLVVVAIGLSVWRGLGVGRAIAVAAVRAAVQLLAVGAVLRLVLLADLAELLAWLWVVAMVLLAAVVAHRRAPELPGGGWLALASIGGSTAVTLAVIFGLRILDIEPVTVVVIAGITIGNTMPSVVLAGDRLVAELDEHRARIEGLLGLGFDSRGVVRQVAPSIARVALIPQIERTKVVGIIALPGAMTGLLLAGVAPIDAVLVQIVVMYLVLGSVATAVIVTATVGMARSFTPDLRLRSSPLARMAR